MKYFRLEGTSPYGRRIIKMHGEWWKPVAKNGRTAIVANHLGHTMHISLHSQDFRVAKNQEVGQSTKKFKHMSV